jgi:hypothetical protein
MTDTTTTQSTSNPTSVPSTGDRRSPEYIASMVARKREGFGTPEISRPNAGITTQTNTPPAAEAPKVETPTKPERPSHIPEKFWDASKGEVRVDDLMKSYSELEKNRSQPKVEPPATTEKTTETPKEGEGGQTEGDTTEKPVETPKDDTPSFDWQSFDQHLAANGTVTDEQKAHLEKIGVPDFMLASLDKVVQMAREGAAFRTAEYVGGKANLDAIMEAAATQLTADEQKSYNSMLSSENWKMAMDSLKSRFLPGNTEQNASGHEDLFGGGSVQTQGGALVVPFASRREQTEAINKVDDRGRRLYDIDDAYRAQVRQRIGAGRRR